MIEVVSSRDELDRDIETVRRALQNLNVEISRMLAFACPPGSGRARKLDDRLNEQTKLMRQMKRLRTQRAEIRARELRRAVKLQKGGSR
jgi:hypothetical protein